MIFFYQSSRKGWQATGWNVKRPFCAWDPDLNSTPFLSGAVCIVDGPLSSSVDSHTVESLPDFRCAILVRLING